VFSLKVLIHKSHSLCICSLLSLIFSYLFIVMCQCIDVWNIRVDVDVFEHLVNFIFFSYISIHVWQWKTWTEIDYMSVCLSVCHFGSDYSLTRIEWSQRWRLPLGRLGHSTVQVVHHRCQIFWEDFCILMETASVNIWQKLVALRGSAVERQSLASVLLPSCARPVADGWPLMWVCRPV